MLLRRVGYWSGAQQAAKKRDTKQQRLNYQIPPYETPATACLAKQLRCKLAMGTVALPSAN